MKVKTIGNKVIYNGINILFAFILLFYAGSIGYYLATGYNNILLLALIFSGIFFACYVVYFLSNKLLRDKDLLQGIIIIGVSILIYTVWAIYSDTQPVSDYKVLIDGARAINDGTFRELSHNKEGYYYFYNFQTGYTIYLSLMLRLVFNSIIGLKISEIIIMTLINLFMYLILKKFIASKLAFCGALFYTLFLPNVYGSSIINNQHISTFMIMLFLYFFIDKKIKFSKVLAGLFLALAYILRQSMIIFIIALVCVGITKIFSSDKKDLKKAIISILTILITFGLCIFVYDTVLKLIDFVPVSAVQGNLSFFKFVLGITRGKGMTGAQTVDAEHTQVYFDLQKYGFDYDLYNRECKNFVIDKYSNVTKELLSSYFEKTVHFAGNVDNQIDYIGKTMDYNILSIMKNIGLCQYNTLILFSFVTSIMRFFKKFIEPTDNTLVTFSKIAFIGFFLVHIFIESQTRYRFDQYYLLVIISFISVGNLSVRFKKENPITN